MASIPPVARVEVIVGVDVNINNVVARLFDDFSDDAISTEYVAGLGNVLLIKEQPTEVLPAALAAIPRYLMPSSLAAKSKDKKPASLVVNIIAKRGTFDPAKVYEIDRTAGIHPHADGRYVVIQIDASNMTMQEFQEKTTKILKHVCTEAEQRAKAKGTEPPPSASSTKLT